MFDIITVGHFAIDLIVSPTISTPKPSLGGAPTYVSLAAGKLDARVSVISKVGEDFSEEYLGFLSSNAIDLSGLTRVKGTSTTRFILKSANRKRKLQLKSQAPPILLQDIPRSLRAKAIHIAPIVHEISREVIEQLRTQADTLSLDPQGFVRRFDQRGNTRLNRWYDPLVLQQVDLYKSSQNEIKTVTGLADLHSAMKKIRKCGVKTVIVTAGVKGSTLLHEDRFYDIPPCQPTVVKDATGAGDAFIGGFLAEYTKEKEPMWCACAGSAAASFVVEGVGPSVFGEKEEAYERAADIYDKVVVQRK